jgi:hypothetical protein
MNSIAVRARTLGMAKDAGMIRDEPCEHGTFFGRKEASEIGLPQLIKRHLTLL